MPDSDITPESTSRSSPLPHGRRVRRSRDVHDRAVGAGSRPRSAINENALIKISVVMPVRNEARHIEETLGQLLSQDYPGDRLEILVVDGQSTDDTRQIVEQFIARGAPVRLLDNALRWSSAARNLGAQAATGDVVLVIDGHCEIPTNQHLRSVAHAFLSSGADVVGRPQPLTVRNATPLQRAIAIARASRLGHHPDSFIYASEDQFVPAESVGAAYRKSVFETIGFFDERFDACEDVDFNYRADRAGLRCFLAADAKVHYFPRRRLTSLFTQLARYGQGRVRLARKHPSTRSWKSMLPACFVAWLGFWAFLSIGSSSAQLVLGATLLFYVSALLAESIRLALVHRQGWPALWLPAVFATIHFAAGIGVLREWLTGWRWKHAR